MAFILYPNGITEEYRPKGHIFTEKELVDLFKEFNVINTSRVIVPLNTWCIYGDVIDVNEYNVIASEITKEKIFTHVLFVHDSELDINWKVTDIIYKSYIDFSKDLMNIIELTAVTISNTLQENSGEESEYLPILTPKGTTKDKRILFELEAEQHPQFYEDEKFYIFSKKIYDYLSKNKQVKEPFTIYTDKKAVIFIESNNVKNFLNSMIEKFKTKEEYEICSNISKMIIDWENIRNKPAQRKKKTNKKNLDD